MSAALQSNVEAQPRVFRAPAEPVRRIRRPKPPKAVPILAQTRGRPATYHPEFDELVYRLCALGLADQEVAQIFFITTEAMYQWDHAHPSFLEARTSARVIADSDVAVSLYKRAVGYKRRATKVFMRNSDEAPIYAEYEEDVPPDVAAASLWLRNRRPDLWQDKSDVNVNISGGLGEMLTAAMERLRAVSEGRVIDGEGRELPPPMPETPMIPVVREAEIVPDGVPFED